jgi:FMN phosphatase YigB (HAD superfamily)
LPHPCYNTAVKRIVSFDLDGTLVDAKYGDLVWNQGIPEEYARVHGLSVDAAKTLIRNQYVAVGDADIKWYHIEYWLAKFQLPVSPGELLRKYESSIELHPGAKEVLEALSRKYTLIVASNAARIFVEKELSHTGIASFFSHVISATSDLGIVKKEGLFYWKLCSLVGAEPTDIVHVGDHPVYDYEAPRLIGIESYLFRAQGGGNRGDSPNGGVIYNLRDLLEYL